MGLYFIDPGQCADELKGGIIASVLVATIVSPFLLVLANDMDE